MDNPLAESVDCSSPLYSTRIITQLSTNKLDIKTVFVLTVLWGTVKKYGALQSRIM